MLRKININCNSKIEENSIKVSKFIFEGKLFVSIFYYTLRKGRRLILKVSKRFRITNYGNADCCGISSASGQKWNVGPGIREGKGSLPSLSILR